MLKKIIDYIRRNKLKGVKFILIRLSKKLPNYILSRKFKSCGKDFYMEKYIKIFNPQYIEIGNKFRAYYGARIECIDKYRGKKFNPKLVIGDNVIINNFIHIGVLNEVRIDDNVLFGSKIFISDHNHGDYGKSFHSSPNEVPVKRELHSAGKVHIKENCWIGENVTILPNVTIGKGSVIGSNSVVSADIPDYSIAVGSPAKVVKKYDFNLSKWEKFNG